MKLAPFAFLAAMCAACALTTIAHAETYPVVADATQQDRDAQRRSILANELATEKKSLSDANADMAAAIKAQKSPDEVQAIAAQALGHSNNIESLQRELDGLGTKTARPRRSAFVPEAQPEAPAPSAQAPAEVPYWDVYHRKQNVPPVAPDDLNAGAALNSPDAGDKEARSGSTK
ncbi:hypothetical protein [Pseudomonas eucalypticola]|uniref:Uncharacterized protein n=1 Tax=Pseudomonas eucalypticola TaxID=2599595 RepID=A0A7D5I1X4_9PSED|nr:hypothetical protein [Pseudomonas eucalypticola]QKZ07851.1 hypothetical protein HWQ56_28920 [Pseudomonas eucalypticola]